MPLSLSYSAYVQPRPVTISRHLRSVSFVGCADLLVEHLTCDSRECRPGSLFAVIPGTKSHGEQFIPEALGRGAKALLVEYPLARFPVKQIVVADVRQAYARLTQALYGYPARHMGVVGVTGTNGKTTTTWLVRSMLEQAGKRCGMLGTIEYDDGARCTPSKLTTPSPAMSARWLGRMIEHETRHVAMELSSHALSQSRTEGIDLDVAVLTNITHDHLDYHRDFDSYRRAKARIFQLLKSGGAAVVNVDDPAAAQLVSEVPAQTQLRTIGIDQSADINATITLLDHAGTTFRVLAGAQEVEMRTSLVGRHNVSNCLCAIAAGLHLGLTLEQCRDGIAALTHVPGRLQQVNPGGRFAVYVDYAHTPDAVSRAVGTVRQTTLGKVICVIGAGGDRDRAKRPLMARAAQVADTIVLTSDNPRSEEPLEIIQQMLSGIESQTNVHVEPDRRRAIAWAIERASAGDVVLVAGKGHETVQEIAGERFPFDDVAVCRECLGLATLDNAEVHRVRRSSHPVVVAASAAVVAIAPPHFETAGSAREGDAPAEPHAVATVNCDAGSAGASPSRSIRPSAISHRP